MGTGRSIELLEVLKDRVVSGSTVPRDEGRPLLSQQWEELAVIAKNILEACQGKDLGGVASSTRKMKNKLRKRQFRRRLEALEATDDAGKKKIDGACQCSNCGAVIDGSKKPCIEGALCTKCALDKKKDGDDEDTARKALKGSGKDVSSKGASLKGTSKEKDKTESGSSLRSRRY
jgi:hypothetical protein